MLHYSMETAAHYLIKHQIMNKRISPFREQNQITTIYLLDTVRVARASYVWLLLAT